MKASDISKYNNFQKEILEGIPDVLPNQRPLDKSIDHAPVRADILSHEEKKLAIKNALRYFDKKHHGVLAPEFAEELKLYGRIYMYRLRPSYKITARSINDFPHKSEQAAAIMLMISNNLDYAVAQYPEELITYGGNGAVFQNWAQYRLTMKYLAEMAGGQTLIMYSGHPLGLFPSHSDAPRVVITNGMVVPNYSAPEHWEKFNALGVSQYGQMTAGSFMYIGPQGIVHGTTITLLNAGRLLNPDSNDLAGKLFVTSGLGGMSGAQAKASVIAGAVGVIAEINPKAARKRYEQGWLDEIYDDLDELLDRIETARAGNEAVSLGYVGNIVNLWEKLADNNIKVDLGSDQTSLHNPWAGGYYPVGVSFDEANEIITGNPAGFKELVRQSLRRQVKAINKLSANGMYFWDYGNAFLLEAGRAGADVMLDGTGRYKYPSYVEDIMGPLCFDYGFGPFRWVCTSSLPGDLELTDKIAAEVLTAISEKAPDEIKLQLSDNIRWIRAAGEYKMVVGSQARILYSDAEGRTKIALAFNQAIRKGEISGPVVIGRDHHDVSGTDSPYRETANIYDGSQFTADMAVQNVIGDAFRGATWISLHNGGGVGWGEVINGGFGMLLDGSEQCDGKIKMMIHWDVNNGIARRNWGRNKEAMFAISRAMEAEPKLKVTMPNIAEDELINIAVNSIFD